MPWSAFFLLGMLVVGLLEKKNRDPMGPLMPLNLLKTTIYTVNCTCICFCFEFIQLQMNFTMDMNGSFHLNLVKASVAVRGDIPQWNPSIAITFGTTQSILIKGGVLISEIVLYTALCSSDNRHCPY